MPALFLTTSEDVLKTDLANNASLVHSDLIDNSTLASSFGILTSAAAVFSETVQFFQSFDDLIHHYYFGKGVGQIRLDLMYFLNCDGSEARGLRRLYESIGSKRGKKIMVDFENIHVEGILMDFTINAQSEPLPHYIVSVNLGMTDSNLTPPDIAGGC